jgi:predicted outer membrane protein
MRYSSSRRYGIAITVATALAVSACGPVDTTDDDTLHTTATGEVGAMGERRSPAATVSMLSAADQAEVDMGQLAQERATNARVREYAQLMVTEHSASMRRAGELARGMAMDTTQQMADPQNDAMMGEHSAMMNQLQNTERGAQFDSLYMASQVRMHEDLLRRLEAMTGTAAQATGAPQDTTRAAAQQGGTQTAGTITQDYPAGTATENAQLDQHLQTTVEMVRRHLERAREVQQQLGAGQ